MEIALATSKLDCIFELMIGYQYPVSRLQRSHQSNSDSKFYSFFMSKYV